MDPTEVLNEVNQRLAVLRGELKSRHRGVLETVRKFPEWPVRRKVLEVVYERLTELRGELAAQTASSAPPPAGSLDEIQAALELVEKDMDDDTAWQSADLLRAMIPHVARDATIFRLLSVEHNRKADGGVLWSDCFDRGMLQQLLDEYDRANNAFKSSKSRDLGALCLETIFKQRNDDGRHDRARLKTRSRYLVYLSFVLLIVSLLLAFADRLVADAGLLSVTEMLLVLAGGGLGATISGSMKIRDLQRIADMEAVWSGAFAQISIGAALAAILVVTLQTSFIELGGGDDTLAKWITIAIVAGFSEPFALRILEKVAGLSQPTAAKSVESA